MGLYLGLLPAKEEIKWVTLEEREHSHLGVADYKKAKIPEFGSREREMAWLYTYVLETFQPMSVQSVCVVHGATSQSGSESVLYRAQVEGVVLAALGSLKREVISAKKQRIGTAFGLKRGASLSGVPHLEELREARSLPKYMDEPLAAALLARR